MDRENGVASVDAAEVGLALAFPGGLGSYIEALAGEAAPVEKAVAAAWAGMDSLRVVTAELNGSVARPRVVGLSRARQGLAASAQEPDWQGGARSGWSEGTGGGDDRPVSPVREAGGVAVAQAAREPGIVDSGGAAGASEQGESVAPVIVRLSESLHAPDPDGWTSGMAHDDVAVAPAIADAVPYGDAGGLQRSIAPVKVRVVRGAGSKGGLGDPRGVGLPDSAMEATPTAVAPSGMRGSAHGPGMRADVASALRSREMVREAIGDDEVASSAQVPQEQRRAAAGGAMARMDNAGEAGGDVLSGEVTAPLPPGRNGGAGGGDLVLGNIMLDGHPVGTWMGSRMSRDAARPGAGTTSFDPRQAPAWTPSGAL